MADKPPTVAVLSERLNTAISIARWWGGIMTTAVVVAGGFLLSRVIDHGEKLSAIQTTLTDIQNEQKKAVPEIVGELIKKPTNGKFEATAAILESAQESHRASDPALLANT
jgi:hypothetical protein